MKITEIFYRETHSSIVLENGEKYSLSFDLVSRLKLSSGMDLSDGEYEVLRHESEGFDCWRKALNYLAMRMHSSYEMKIYLTRKKFQPEIIDDVVGRLKQLDYIDDHDFALRFIGAKLRKKAVGSGILRRELFKKGIDRETIELVMNESGACDTDMQRLYELAEKKYAALEGKKNRLQKLSGFLYQRGFTSDEVRLTVERIRKDQGCENRDVFY